MVTIEMNYPVLPGKGEAFVTECNEVIRAMQEEEGHSSSHVYQDVNEEGSYLIVSEWESRDAFDAFLRSEAFRSKMTSWGEAEILAGRPRHQYLSPQG